MDLLGVQVCDCAVRVMTNRRAVQMERYRAVCQHGEFTIQQRQCRALVRSGRQYANRLDAMFRTHSDVVGPGAAGLDAQSGSPPHAAVVGSANCDGAAHDFVAENLRAPPAAAAPNQLAMASVIRSRAIAGMQKPPLKRTASGLAMCRRSSMCDREFSPAPIAIAACLRNAARCFVMAGSVGVR